MVRTRDTASIKVTGAKAPRKASFTPTATSSDDSSGGKNKYSGGNSYCPRETPVWQKDITCFFNRSSNSEKTNDTEEPVESVTATTSALGSPSASNSESPVDSNAQDTSNKENIAASSSSK